MARGASSAMRNFFLPFLFLAILLGACSPAQYKVNPPDPKDDPAEEDALALDDPVLEEEVSEIPEAQREGYMRIVGDLRWDQLTSPSEWMNRFKCLYEKQSNYLVPKDQEKVGCVEDVGGIGMGPYGVSFGDTSGTASGRITTKVVFVIPEAADYRAFDALIKQKYDLATNENFGKLYCSKYTCWKLNYYLSGRSGAGATPTPYTVSILDNKKVDTSEF